MFYRFILIVFLFSSFYSCRSVYSFQKLEYSSVEIDSTLKSNSHIVEIIEPYKSTLSLTMNEVVCKTGSVLSKSKPESKLGNLVADATFFESEKYFGIKPDFAIVNYGGIRIPSLPKGDISLGKIYELMPFDNYLNLVYIKGNILQEVCDLIALNGGWPVSGLSFTIRNQKAEAIKIQGKQLDHNIVYKLAISDYLANGGDNMSMLKTLKREKSNLLLRDAFIQHFKAETSFIDAEIENRIIVE
ncbi:MAG: 5'-nucleotidase C-terminal domain-containing protein [Chitinophagales bacterium]